MTTSSEQVQNEAIGETIRRERSRLSRFIQNRLPDPDVAEDILQDVFYELTEAYRLAKPIERVASWLFAVARNKINDWYRKPRTVSLDSPPASADPDEETPVLGEWLAVSDDMPDSDLFRETILDAIDEALAELPAEQRDVFVRHEIDGQSFNDMVDELGVSLNTLLSRKRYAVLHLRKRLRNLYDELNA
ncbi:MAG: sigma-70 family RNA polymerase sigma factor [Cytophagales bacterium]|nr:MAG: sigma-70 family RNA polymerase sigma factor [Cytophagales bacterium]